MSEPIGPDATAADEAKAPAVALEYATQARRAPSRRGRGFLAVCATIVLGGAGHILFGFRRRGLGWFLLCLGVGVAMCVAAWNPPLVPGLIVILPLALVVQLAMLVDAYRCGNRSSVDLLHWPVARYGLGIGIVAVAAVLHPDRSLAFWFRDHVVEAFSIPTKSMHPALDPGDKFLAHKRLSVRRWDIVAFVAPDVPRQKYAKRIVGLPGETVELVGNQVMIDGKPITLPTGLVYESQPHLGPHNGCAGHPMTLGRDEYYVLGDNSPISADSRYWTTALHGHQPGTIGGEDIIGVATWIYWPRAHWRRLRD